MRPGEPLIDWVGRTILVLGLAAVLTALIVDTVALAASIGLGVGLAWGNLWLLRNLGRRLVAEDGQKRALGLLFFKFLLLIVLFFAITRWLPLDVLGLLGGFSTGVVAIVAGTYLGPRPDAIVVKAESADRSPSPGISGGGSERAPAANGAAAPPGHSAAAPSGAVDPADRE